MSKRKNYGAFILIASLVLGVLLLTGSFIWMQDKANMMLAVFVLILYGVGQWMTVVYWQNIQSDWESTGEVLGRLQQAVSDIPAALDTNLKAIAQKLSEGQQQALSKLQSEVSEGARQTLEKGALLIGESISKNFQAPVGSLNSLLVSFTEKSGEQAQLLKNLVDDARKDSRQSVEKGASLVSESLDKNLRAPLSAMEASLAAWRDQANAQAQATRAFGEELRKAQAEWTLKAQSLADGLAEELKSLAAAGVRSGEQAQAAWAERAAELQSGWETQIRGMQQNLVEAVSNESAKLGGSLAAGADLLISRVESLQSSQSEAQSEVLDRALAGLEAQSRTVGEASASFEDGLERMRDASLKLIADVEAKASEGQTRLVEEISNAQRQAFGEAGKTLEAQSQIGLEVAGKVSELAEQMNRGSKDFQELAHLAQVNQVEMQAGVGMLNSGLASILERLEKQAAAGDGQQIFLSELGRALATFQERASEVLIENAMKTQEILMEVLNNSERADRKNQEISSEAVA
jgi:hypothetical protein